MAIVQGKSIRIHHAANKIVEEMESERSIKCHQRHKSGCWKLIVEHCPFVTDYIGHNKFYCAHSLPIDFKCDPRITKLMADCVFIQQSQSNCGGVLIERIVELIIIWKYLPAHSHPHIAMADVLMLLHCPPHHMTVCERRKGMSLSH